MLKTLIILFLFINKDASCMNDLTQDNNSQCDMEITLAEQEQICFFELLPEELILKIIKLCISRCKNEKELGAIIACLQRINRYFNQIINNDMRLQIYIIEKFENIKKHFFATQAIVYPRMPHKLNKNAITLFSKTNLPEKITNFSAHKASYIKFLKKRKRMNNSGLSLELINAVKLGKLDLVWLLIYKISDINFADFNDDTLLMHAAINGHKEIAELLISNGAEVNSKNTNCETALMYAAYKGHKAIVELLLANGADVNAVNINGATALTMAIGHFQGKIAQILVHAKLAKIKKRIMDFSCDMLY